MGFLKTGDTIRKRPYFWFVDRGSKLARDQVKQFRRAVEEAASFLSSRLREGLQVRISADTDPDGLASGNILARCLAYYDVPFHISFGGPPEPEDLKELSEQDYDFFVFLDQGTGQYQIIEEHLLEADREVMIMDHHPGEVPARPGLAHLNPHSFGLNGTRDISSSGLAYLVVREIDEKFDPLSEMALIGAVGDRQDLLTGFTGFNQEIVERAVEKDYLVSREGLKLDGRTSPILDCIRFSVRPYLLGLSGDEESSRELIEGLGLNPQRVLEELDSKEEKELRDAILEEVEVPSTEALKNSLWGIIYTPKIRQVVGPKNIHEYVTMLDACEKLKSLEIGFSALLGDGSVREKALDTLQAYRERIIEAMNWLISSEERVKTTSGMRYVDVGGRLQSNMIGEVLSIAIESGVIDVDKPVLGLADRGEDRIKVSARASSECVEAGIHIGEILKEVSGELGGSGGGHDVAAAARLPRERKEEFLRKVDDLLEECG